MREWIQRIVNRFWKGDGGAKNALNIAIPLIMATSSFTIMQFVDRKFLLIYDQNAFAAAVPAGMASFCLISFFFGTATYINTFVAQYVGAKKNHMVGKAIWQAIYFCLMGWMIMLPFWFLAPTIFKMASHAPAVCDLEIKYFRILTIGSGFVLLNVTLSSFFSGRGKTYTVMWIRIISLVLNVPLDYAMIFGKFGFPQMGIIGAAWATVIATGFTTVMFSLMVFSAKNNKIFSTISGWRFDKIIFKRLVNFGFPNGIQFFINIFAFSFFLIMVGRLGSNALAASNAVWSLHLLAYLPMIGFSITVSTIVGQEIGRQRIHIAKIAIWNILVMILLFMGTISSCFVLIPKTALWTLFKGAPSSNIADIQNLSIIIMRYMALFLMFDAVNLVFNSVIKAAGDTKFVMWSSLWISLGVLIIPSYFFSTISPSQVTTMWAFATAYVISTTITFVLRYRSGKWEKMNVIGTS